MTTNVYKSSIDQQHPTVENKIKTKSKQNYICLLTKKKKNSTRRFKQYKLMLRKKKKNNIKYIARNIQIRSNGPG